MKISSIALGISFLLSTVITIAAEIKPQFKRVKLEEFTSLELKVLPHAGTQLTFPFLLDNPELKPSLKIRLANSDGFEVPTSEQEISNFVMGQNTLTIIGLANEQNSSAVYLSNLFITIGGYNISISLKTTYRPQEHISNVVFEMGENDVTNLVEKLVERKTQALSDSYKEKEQRLEDKAKSLALSHVAKVALEKPKKTRYMKERELDFNGVRTTIFVEEFLKFGDDYGILVFELENNSANDITLNDVLMYSVNGDNEIAINGAFSCDKPLYADSKTDCTFVTRQVHAGKERLLKLSLITDRGEGTIEW